MGSLDSGNDGQAMLPGLFEQPRLFFSTNQKNLLSILGSGILFPAPAQFRYDNDSREYFGGKIGLWKNGIPDWNIEPSSLDLQRTVILEFDGGLLAPFLQKGLILDHKDCLVFDCPLPLSAVKAIYMRSQVYIDDFLLRLTDDVIADSSLFSVILDCPILQVPVGLEAGAEGVALFAAKFVDRIGGAMKCLTKMQPSQPYGTDYSELLISICIDHFGFGNLENGGSGSADSITSTDRSIVLALLEALEGIHPERGMDYESVLASMNDRLLALDEVSRVEFATWLDYSRKVLGAELDVPTLDDKGDLIKRGILLFLLRPDLDRLRKSVDSSIKPGQGVLAVATFLCGYFTGLLRLGSEYKGDYSSFVSFVEKLLLAFSCKDITNIESATERNTTDTPLRVLRVNGVNIWLRTIAQNETLARVVSQAKTAGYELDYDYENHRLSYNFIFPDDRSQQVYIELIDPLPSGVKVIRFVSPCQDLSKYKKRSPTGPKAIDFLARNGGMDMYSSFAISESLEAMVVVATQIVRTMQDEEFELLLNHVASVADQYERDILGKDAY